MSTTEIWLSVISVYLLLVSTMLAHEYVAQSRRRAHHKFPAHYDVIFIVLFPLTYPIVSLFWIRNKATNKWFIRGCVMLETFSCIYTETSLKHKLYSDDLLSSTEEKIEYRHWDHHVWKFSVWVQRNGLEQQLCLLDKLPKGVAVIG